MWLFEQECIVFLLLFVLPNAWTIQLIKYYKEYPFGAVVENTNKNLLRICVAPGWENF
jgi:hypothetical protein